MMTTQTPQTTLTELTGTGLREERERAENELRSCLGIYKQLLARQAELDSEMRDVRNSIEAAMVRGRFDTFRDKFSLLSVSRRRNSSTRRMDYDRLQKANAVLYQSLIDGKFIVVTPPKTEFKIEVRHLKGVF